MLVHGQITPLLLYWHSSNIRPPVTTRISGTPGHNSGLHDLTVLPHSILGNRLLKFPCASLKVGHSVFMVSTAEGTGVQSLVSKWPAHSVPGPHRTWRRVQSLSFPTSSLIYASTKSQRSILFPYNSPFSSLELSAPKSSTTRPLHLPLCPSCLPFFPCSRRVQLMTHSGTSRHSSPWHSEMQISLVTVWKGLGVVASMAVAGQRSLSHKSV